MADEPKTEPTPDPNATAGSAGAGGDDAAAKLAALRPKLDALYKERNDLLKRFEGLDPDAARAAIAAQAEREKADAEKKGDFERLKAKLLEDHTKALEGERGVSTRLRGALERQLVRAEAVRAIAAAKGDPDLLLPHVLAAVQVVEDDGEFVARVLDPKAKDKHRFNAKGEFMSIEELVTTELRERFPRAFEGSGAAGSGATGSTSGAGGAVKAISRTAFDALPQSAKFKHISDGGTVTDG